MSRECGKVQTQQNIVKYYPPDQLSGEYETLILLRLKLQKCLRLILMVKHYLIRAKSRENYFFDKYFKISNQKCI